LGIPAEKLQRRPSFDCDIIHFARNLEAEIGDLAVVFDREHHAI
jgi:hypothetical protein